MAKTFDISESDSNEIKMLNSKLSALKSLINTEKNTAVIEVLVNKVVEAQIAYDKWFFDIELKLGVTTTSQNSWQVDFIGNKLTLN